MSSACLLISSLTDALQWLWFRPVGDFASVSIVPECIAQVQRCPFRRKMHRRSSQVPQPPSILFQGVPLPVAPWTRIYCALANTPYSGNHICTAKYRTAHRARSKFVQGANGEIKGRNIDKFIHRRVWRFAFPCGVWNVLTRILGFPFQSTTR